MAKSTNIYVRLEPELKEQAENILEQLGIPLSNAVNIFLKQVVMHKGIPFDVKILNKKLIEVSALTESELEKELEKGYEDLNNGKVKEAEKAFSDIRKDYNL